MADKSKMKCNVVRPSDRAGKKKMVKACEGGKENTDIIIVLRHENLSRPDISARQPSRS